MTALVGIDKGTTMTKAVVFDAETGHVLGMARRPTHSFRPRPDWHEEDMEGTWRGAADAVRDAIGAAGVDPGSIAGVGVSGHMGGLWALDRDGAPLGRAIAWPDARAAGLLARWQADGRVRGLYEMSGNAPIPGLPLVLLAYMREQDAGFFDRAAHVFCAKDFINYRLTGRIATDESDLSFFPCDIRARRLSADLFDLAGLAGYARLVPEVLPIGAPVGRVTAEAAAATGLRAGTPVTTGAGDAVAAAIGVGALTPGQAVTVIGTSFMNNLTVDRPVTEPDGVGFLFLMPDGRWQRLMSNTGGGSICLDWVIEAFGAACFAGQDAGTVFARVETEARALPPVPNGLLLHPYLNTSGMSAPRHIPEARGSIFGLGLETTPMALIRAVMEGVAFSMIDCYAALDAPVTEIRITGGGARSPLWREICAAAMGRPLLVPEAEEAGALGVALLAARAVGLYPDLSTAAASLVRIAETIEPDAGLGARYAEAFPLFKALGDALSPLWRQRADILAAADERHRR
jgi:sugar (pentulose or hexulose) kinase